MPNAIIDWDRMRLPTTRQTLLTGDVKTVAALNVIQIALFQMMDRRCSGMLDPDFPAVATLRQEMVMVLLVVGAVPLVPPVLQNKIYYFAVHNRIVIWTSSISTAWIVMYLQQEPVKNGKRKHLVIHPDASI